MGTWLFFATKLCKILLLFPICLAFFSDLSDQAVQIVGAMPFLMVFFSTTFSLGAGVPGIISKSSRDIFTRCYLWCMIPGDEPGMEGCPESNTLLFLILPPSIHSIWLSRINLTPSTLHRVYPTIFSTRPISIKLGFLGPPPSPPSVNGIAGSPNPSIDLQWLKNRPDYQQETRLAQQKRHLSKCPLESWWKGEDGWKWDTDIMMSVK